MRKLIFCSEAIVLLLLFFLLLTSPQTAFDGAMRGIKLWALTLVPSILPFLILAEILLSSGLVGYLGKFLEPLMRPLFHLPGSCGFGVALGFTSGFPMGAVAASSLVRNNLCSPEQAARLAAFTNNSSPLFLLAAIAVGLLNRPEVGIVLLFAHYGANLLLGLILGRFSPKPPPQPKQALHLNSQSLGSMLSQSVRQGLTSILNIGGFVTLFSVIIALLEQAGFFDIFNLLWQPLLNWLHFPQTTAQGLSFGMVEMTLGVQETASGEASLLVKLLLISFILGFSGLSVQAQVCAILAQENISGKYFLLLRPLHGLLSALLTLPLFYFLYSHPQEVSLSFNEAVTSSPILSSFFITFLPLALLMLTFLFIALLKLWYKWLCRL